MLLDRFQSHVDDNEAVPVGAITDDTLEQIKARDCCFRPVIESGGVHAAKSRNPEKIRMSGYKPEVADDAHQDATGKWYSIY